MITGAHVILYSTDADADRAFFRDVLDFPSVDAGGGWLIFGLPPTEMAVHPAPADSGQGSAGGTHEVYLMCDDVEGFVATMAARGVACSALRREQWGVITQVTLPGGGVVGVYEPTHPSPA